MYLLVMKFVFRTSLSLFLIIMIVLNQFAQADHQPPTEKERALELVRVRCVLCHYVDRPDYKFAPSLHNLYKRPGDSLRNGTPVTDQTIAAWIANGSSNMPAFKHTLNLEEIYLIVKFLREGWATEIPMLQGSR